MHAHFCFLFRAVYTQAFTLWPLVERRPHSSHTEPLQAPPRQHRGKMVRVGDTDVGLLHSARGVRQERGLAVKVVAIEGAANGRAPLLVSVHRHDVICIIVAGGRRECRLLYRLPNLFPSLPNPI